MILKNEADKIKNNFVISFQDLNNYKDRNILLNDNIDLKKNFIQTFDSIEEGSFDKLIKMKKIEAMKTVLNLHNSIEDINRMALNKNIDKNIEIFFNELKTMDDFKNEADLIENIKNEFLVLNGGKNKYNLKFGIVREEEYNRKKSNTFNTISSTLTSKFNTKE